MHIYPSIDTNEVNSEYTKERKRERGREKECMGMEYGDRGHNGRGIGLFRSTDTLALLK